MTAPRLAARRLAPTPRATTSRTPSEPSGSQPGGPLGHYLRDPGGSLHRVEHAVTQWAIHWGPLTAALIAIAAATIVAARIWRRRRQHAELARDARLVTVLAPPVVDPAGAAALWSNLTGLLRPAWRRRLAGQPHVAFEYGFDTDGLHAAVLGARRRPARDGRTRHPGGLARRPHHHHKQLRYPASRSPISRPSRRGVLSPVGSCGWPAARRCRSAPASTPTRSAPCSAPPPACCPGSEQSCRCWPARSPAAGSPGPAEPRPACTPAGRPARSGGCSTSSLPAPARTATSAARNTAGSGVDRFTSLEYSAQDRAAAGKQRGALFETRVRYTVTTPVKADADRAAIAAASDRLRGRAHAIASAFSVFAEHNHYLRRRLRHPDQAVESRRLGRGDLLSIPELAAIAHIPTDAFAPGLQQAGARGAPAAARHPRTLARHCRDGQAARARRHRTPPPGRARGRRRPPPHPPARRHRVGQVHPARPAGPGRRRRRPGRGGDRPERRPDHRHPRPPPAPR